MPNIDLGSVVGPQGPTGAQGATGPQGPQGLPAKVNGVEPDESGEITLNAGDISGSLRYDASQSLTEEEKTTARNNIGSASQVALAQKPDMITGYPIIYVAKTGDDTTGNGSKSKPYLTIQKAVDSLPKCIAGIVTVTVGAGSYDEELLVMHFFGDGAMTIQGADGEQVQIRDVKVRNVNIGKFILKNVELVGTSNDNYKTSFSVDLAGTYVYLEQVTCTQAAETALLGALRFNRGATAFLSDCTISNKPVAIDIVGATVYMNSTVTGENNTVGIRCGSAWGGFGGFMQKGGATIAGEEQKGYGGQIW